MKGNLPAARSVAVVIDKMLRRRCWWRRINFAPAWSDDRVLGPAADPKDNLNTGRPCCMESQPEQLVIRQHERRACSLSATVRIAVDNASSVELSRSVGDGTGTINATIVDVSNGGAGIECGVFLPRGTAVNVATKLGASTQLVELSVRVQRVMMISREPRYYLGLAYIGSSGERAATLGRLLEHVEPMQTAQEPR